MDLVAYNALANRVLRLESLLNGSLGLKDTDNTNAILQQLNELLQSFHLFLSQDPIFERVYTSLRNINVYQDIACYSGTIQEEESQVPVEELKEKRLLIELEIDQIMAFTQNVDMIITTLDSLSVLDSKDTNASYVKLVNFMEDRETIRQVLDNFAIMRENYNKVLIRSIKLFESRLLLLLEQNSFLINVEDKLRSLEIQIETKC